MKRTIILCSFLSLIISACAVKEDNFNEPIEAIDATIFNSTTYTADIDYNASMPIIFQDKICNYMGVGHFDKNDKRVHVDLRTKICNFNNVIYENKIKGYVLENGIKGIVPKIDKTKNPFIVEVSVSKKVSIVINEIK